MLQAPPSQRWALLETERERRGRTKEKLKEEKVGKDNMMLVR